MYAFVKCINVQIWCCTCTPSLPFLNYLKMAGNKKHTDWEDKQLSADLKGYVFQNLRRQILDFVHRDYQQYAWSLGILSRIVYDVMGVMDPEGLERRSNIEKKKEG